MRWDEMRYVGLKQDEPWPVTMTSQHFEIAFSNDKGSINEIHYYYHYYSLEINVYCFSVASLRFICIILMHQVCLLMYMQLVTAINVQCLHFIALNQSIYNNIMNYFPFLNNNHKEIKPKRTTTTTKKTAKNKLENRQSRTRYVWDLLTYFI